MEYDTYRPDNPSFQKMRLQKTSEDISFHNKIIDQTFMIGVEHKMVLNDTSTLHRPQRGQVGQHWINRKIIYQGNPDI